MLSYYAVYSSVLPVLAAVCVLAYLPYGAYANGRFGRHCKLYHLARCALALTVVSLLYLTIFFFGVPNFTPEAYHLNLHPFIWVTECYDAGPWVMAAQLVLNIAMFVPLGLLLPLAVGKCRRAKVTLPIVFMSTLGIETVQFFIGRSADVDDVIMNFLGGVIGFWLFRKLHTRWNRELWWQELLGLRTVQESAWQKKRFTGKVTKLLPGIQ